MPIPPLTFRSITARSVVLKLKRPVIARIATITEWPLILIDLATDAVMRSATAKEYAAATRIYGLVDGALLWAWDIAALGQDLRTHASGRLERVE